MMSGTSGKRIALFGATGVAGGGVLRACLGAPEVAEVVAVTRRPLPPNDFERAEPKLREVICTDFADPGALAPALAGVDACLYCLGISVSQVSGEAEYRRITYDFALAAARALAAASPGAVFHFVSGRSTSASSRLMWARVKGEAEQALPAIVPTVCWRPAFIDGDAPSGPRLDRALRPVFRVVFGPFRGLYVRAEGIGRAMIHATAEGIREGVLENARIRDLAEA
jgi:uncharacterized protein YbjT (DUF2867 family)